jgi:hypothetical protein
MPPKKKTFFGFSEGEVNKGIDAIFHPLAKKEPLYYIADGIAHGLNERNLPVSIEKFMRYNVPKMFEAYLKKWLRRGG